MDDFEYVRQFGETHEVTQDDGSKKQVHIEDVFHDLNGGLTKVFDAFFGPDEVDSFDASCNTCKHFQRKPMTPEEKAERNIYGMPGQCGFKLVPVRGWHRGQFCGFENGECYVNRRTGMTHKEACIDKSRTS